MSQDLNQVALTGHLTADPELRALPSGQAVMDLRLAFNTAHKNPQTQQYDDKGNFIDVTLFGAQAENAARFLTKGSPVAVQGRLEMDEWQDRNGGGTRSKIKVVAAPGGVKFLHRAPQGGYGQQGGYAPPPQGQQGYPQQGYPQQQQAPPPQGYQAPPPQQAQQAPPPVQPGPHPLNQGQGGTDLPPPDTTGLPPQGQPQTQPSDDDIPF